MAEARRSDQWDHTSSILALTANVNRDPKRQSRPFAADDFHPFRQQSSGIPLDQQTFRVLKAMFPDARVVVIDAKTGQRRES